MLPRGESPSGERLYSTTAGKARGIDGLCRSPPEHEACHGRAASPREVDAGHRSV